MKRYLRCVWRMALPALAISVATAMVACANRPVPDAKSFTTNDKKFDCDALSSNEKKNACNNTEAAALSADAARYHLSPDDLIQCAYRNDLFCVQDTGIPFEFETSPDLEVGGAISITVFSMSAAPRRTFQLDAVGSAASSTVSWPNTAEAADAGLDAQPHEAAPVDGTQDAKPQSSEHDGGRLDGTLMPVTSVRFTNIPSGKSFSARLRVYNIDHQPQTLEIDTPIVFAVTDPGYYFEATLIFPTIFNGSRTISTAPQANGKDDIVGVQTSTAGALDNASLGLNIYPWGYPGKCTRQSDFFGDIMPFVCKWSYLWKPITLQAGTSITHDAFRQYLLGVGYTPIRGIAVTAGVGFVRGQYLASTLFKGEIVSTALATATIPQDVETKYMFEPYIGLSISPDILESIIDVFKQIRAAAPATSESGSQ